MLESCDNDICSTEPLFVRDMKPSTCALDCLPTSLIKIATFTPCIITIVNQSFKSGYIHPTLIKPSLKKHTGPPRPGQLKTYFQTTISCQNPG